MVVVVLLSLHILSIAEPSSVSIPLLYNCRLFPLFSLIFLQNITLPSSPTPIQLHLLFVSKWPVTASPPSSIPLPPSIGPPLSLPSAAARSTILLQVILPHALPPHHTSFHPITPPSTPSHLLPPHHTSFHPITPPSTTLHHITSRHTHSLSPPDHQLLPHSQPLVHDPATISHVVLLPHTSHPPVPPRTFRLLRRRCRVGRCHRRLRCRCGVWRVACDV